MRKSLFSLAILAAAASSPALAQSITHNFYGAMCITAVTAGCAAQNVKIGHCELVRFRPPNLGSNGPSTKFSAFSTGSAVNYKLPSGSLIGTTFQTVNVTQVGQSGDSYDTTMRFTSQAPNAPTINTNFIQIRGDIKDWEDPAIDCDIAFRAAVTKQPRP